jgi:hypothetical protein
VREEGRKAEEVPTGRSADDCRPADRWPLAGDLPVVTRGAARVVTSTYLCGAAFARSRSRARAMDRPSQGVWAGRGCRVCWGQALERCRSARPRVKARGRGVSRRKQAQRATGAAVTRTLRRPRRYPAADPSLAEGRRFCRRCARAIRTRPYGPGSTPMASPSSSLLSRADATQAADRGRWAWSPRPPIQPQ